jgi:hypothetical protein
MLEKFPNEHWNMRQISQHPDLTIDWLIKLPQLDWDLFSISNRKSFICTGLSSNNKNSILDLTIAEDNIDNLSILYQLAKQKVKIYYLDEININSINAPLELQDLGGTVYMINGWFEAKNVIKHIRNVLYELGDFDIWLSCDDSEEEFLASHRRSNVVKNLLLKQEKGPNGLIVYK